jgi:predicted nucleotidyltransferase
MAVLFGSHATGTASDRSDVDLLVTLADPSAARVAQLTDRLERRMKREVQLVRMQDAERIPSLMADALEHGRVLVDREGAWPALAAAVEAWRRRASANEVPLELSMPDLEPS